MKRLLLLFAIPFLFGSWSDKLQLQEKNTPAIIKASYVYNFAKLVGWPDNKSKGNFTIGILGDPDLYKQIVEKYSGKKIGNQAIEIVQLLGVEQLPEMHILFISRKLNDKTAQIAANINKDNTMIITESGDGLRNGATLNFVVVDSQQKFEISETNAEKHGLTIGSTLKSLAHKLVK
ncbi:MAG: YfiR family protein [Flavobacteriales bacterium]|nr:YfiR family protein [Flavobacteriales bacterium]